MNTKNKSGSTVTIDGVVMSFAAARNVEETGTVVAADLAQMMRGELSTAKLLSDCIISADDDRISGWLEYVNAIAAECERRKE